MSGKPDWVSRIWAAAMLTFFVLLWAWVAYWSDPFWHWTHKP